MKLFLFARSNFPYYSKFKLSVMIFTLLVFCNSSQFCFASQKNQFIGQWKLESKQSSVPEDEFKGNLRTLAIKWKAREDKSLPDGPYRERLAEYEKQHLDSQKRRSAKNLKRLGLLLPLINCNSLQIRKSEKHQAAQFTFIYDGVLERKFTISNSGRIFSAKGNELSENIIGYTLAYFDKSKLVLETDTYDGHRVKEELLVYENRLEYKQIFDSFVLTKKVTINKLFAKKTTL